MDTKIRSWISSAFKKVVTFVAAVVFALTYFLLDNLYRIIVIGLLAFLYVQVSEVSDALNRVDHKVVETREDLSRQDSLLSKQVDSLFQMHPWKTPRK